MKKKILLIALLVCTMFIVASTNTKVANAQKMIYKDDLGGGGLNQSQYYEIAYSFFDFYLNGTKYIRNIQ